jgi:hypothetical protein
MHFRAWVLSFKESLARFLYPNFRHEIPTTIGPNPGTEVGHNRAISTRLTELIANLLINYNSLWSLKSWLKDDKLGKICAFLAFSAVTKLYHVPFWKSHSIHAKPVEPQLFWRLIVFYTAGREKKHFKQDLECIIPYSTSYLNVV